MPRALLMLTLILPAAAFAQAPSNCRLYFADQSDWGAKTGFYLDLEGSKLSELPVILGLADGRDWRYTSVRPGFAFDRDYHVRAGITPDHGWVEVQGGERADMTAPWKPRVGPLTVNDRPDWANGPGDWLCVIRKVTVTLARAGQEVARRDFDFSEYAARPLALQFFQPGQPQSAPLASQPGDSLTVDVDLRFAANDLHHWAPFIDRYGQVIQADYPEKVKSDEDLRADVAAEDAELAKMPPSADFDAYGGWLKAGWREPPTGFFRTLRHGGRWWLITPAGNPCFHLGVCAVPAQTWESTPVTEREFIYDWLPPRQGPLAAAWARNLWGINDGTEYVCHYTCNLVRKYGDGWLAKAQERALRRLAAWGLRGGKWGAPAGMVECPVLGHWGVPNLAGHPDVFDPKIREALRADFASQVTPRLKDPGVLGWSVGNEYDEIIKRGETREVLGKGPEVAAKRALMDHALDTLYRGDLAALNAAWKLAAADRAGLYAATPNPPDADVEKLRCFWEDRYYEALQTTLKALDPNHLYLDNWIVPTWWESEEDWRIHARHLDVIGYDRYARQFADPLLLRLQAEADKPTLCGEFSLPAWYAGLRGYGRYGTWTRDETEEGELYEQWVHDAARDPHCVGLAWFQYHDQPMTGRGPGRGPYLTIGEHYAFGLVTGTDRVRWPLARKLREANLQAAAWRNGP